MRPFFTADSVKVAYQARFHFGWYAHGRTEKLSTLEKVICDTLSSVCDRQDYHFLEHEIEPDCLRAVLSLKPSIPPSEVTRFVKGNIATAVRNEAEISELWSRGWFCRSVGTVTTETIRQYVHGQYEHHRAAPESDPQLAKGARYRHRGDAEELRKSAHATFEYNLHVVLVMSGREPILDLEVAESLAVYLRQVCEKKSWIPWNIDVLPDHLHMLVGVSPSESPESVSLGLLNNVEYFVQRRALIAISGETCLQPGYFAGTVGAATTAQVKAFLSRQRSREEAER